MTETPKVEPKLKPEDIIEERSGQRRTNRLIEAMVARSPKYEKLIFEARSSNKSGRRERMSRLHGSRPYVIGFLLRAEDSLNPAEIKRVERALVLMLKLHINDNNRADGTGPNIKHPLEVASGVLESYKGTNLANVCIAALLHDAIEDQKKKLVLAQNYKDHGEISDSLSREIEEHGALKTVLQMFGEEVKKLVESVSIPPGMYKPNMSASEKNAVYKKFVQSIVNDSENPESFVIKWQDARANMLPVGQVWHWSQKLKRQAGYVIGFKPLDAKILMKDVKKREKIYIKLRDKYEPVLREVFLPAFENMSDEHPLYTQRGQAIQDIKRALNEQYSLDA